MNIIKKIINNLFNQINGINKEEEKNELNGFYTHTLSFSDKQIEDMAKADAKMNEIKNGLFIDEYGNKRWYRDNELHRDDDLPAVELINGNKIWFQKGQRHRENDKPAVELSNGTKVWFQYDQAHRDNDKPAIEYANGDKLWLQKGIEHRDNGLPAVMMADGTEEFWVNGEKIPNNFVTPYELYLTKNYNNLFFIKDYNDIQDSIEKLFIHAKGTVIDFNGNKRSYENFLLHSNDDLPAIELIDGTREWYQKGNRHRDNDKPAVIRADGTEEYWVNGEQITKAEILNKKKMKDLRQSLIDNSSFSKLQSPNKKT